MIAPTRAARSLSSNRCFSKASSLSAGSLHKKVFAGAKASLSSKLTDNRTLKGGFVNSGLVLRVTERAINPFVACVGSRSINRRLSCQRMGAADDTFRRCFLRHPRRTSRRGKNKNVYSPNNGRDLSMIFVARYIILWNSVKCYSEDGRAILFRVACGNNIRSKKPKNIRPKNPPSKFKYITIVYRNTSWNVMSSSALAILLEGICSPGKGKQKYERKQLQRRYVGSKQISLVTFLSRK